MCQLEMVSACATKRLRTRTCLPPGARLALLVAHENWWKSGEKGGTRERGAGDARGDSAAAAAAAERGLLVRLRPWELPVAAVRLFHLREPGDLEQVQDWVESAPAPPVTSESPEWDD